MVEFKIVVREGGEAFSPLPAPVFPDYLLFSVGVIAL